MKVLNFGDTSVRVWIRAATEDGSTAGSDDVLWTDDAVPHARDGPQCLARCEAGHLDDLGPHLRTVQLLPNVRRRPLPFCDQVAAVLCSCCSRSCLVFWHAVLTSTFPSSFTFQT